MTGTCCNTYPKRLSRLLYNIHEKVTVLKVEPVTFHAQLSSQAAPRAKRYPGRESNPG